jgi:hypothetical protein
MGGLMAKGLADHYRGLLDSQRAVADACIGDGDAFAAVTKSHNFLMDLDRIREIISERPEVVCLDLAIQEYQYGLFALIGGQYRHAFGSLRLSFELMLATVYFSAHEVKLRQWLNGSRDLTWQSLADEENGIFSADFVRAFSPIFLDLRRQYLGMAVAVYREASEFVHGNPTTHRDYFKDIQFVPDAILEWHERAEVVRLSSLYALLVRYSPLFVGHSKASIEATYLEAFGDQEAVQAFFQEVTGD